FGTSTFFLLTVLMVVEFLAGVSIGFRNRQRRVPAAAPAAVEREPASAPVAPAPANLAPAEPSFDPPHQDVKPPESVFPPSQHAEAEPAPKPVPTLAVIRNSDGVTPVTDRKVSDWNVSDLVSDSTPDGAVKTPPKP
ncbi:MAG: hypothetical protein ACRCV5_16600, partial [Afipia sp.]